MRRLLVVVLALCMAGAVFAAQSPTGAKFSTADKGLSMGDGAMGPRTGGDTIAQATVIAALPYTDTGATCSFVNDYDEICPYSGSTSPDVVYSYMPTQAENITVDLCASQYDTKVYIYAGGVGNLVACNDDAGCGYSGYQSKVAGVAVTAGVTYYIVVDGYGGACGTYNMTVSAPPPCVVDCPAGSMPEGETPCSDNYVDSFNGGCNSIPNVFEALPPQAGGCADVCGLSGTYLYQGLSYRDTDWYDVVGDGNTMTYQCTAEFPLLMFFFTGLNCQNLIGNSATADPCVQATLSASVASGTHVWLWAGPSVFTGVPCSAKYWMHVCHIYTGPPPVPAQRTTWGSIKNSYK